MTRQRKAGKPADPCILVVTTDDRLYYWLFSVSLDLGWSIQRAPSIEAAQRCLGEQPLSVVVYDERLPRADWPSDLCRLSALAEQPVVLLAAEEVDENLWQTVLSYRGYDAVKRFAAGSEWMQSLQFALLAKLRSLRRA